MQGSDRNCIRIIQIRQYTWQASCSHGLARTRGTEQQQVVPSRRCHFQGTAQTGLTTDVSQVLIRAPGRYSRVGRFQKSPGPITGALRMNQFADLLFATKEFIPRNHTTDGCSQPSGSFKGIQGPGKPWGQHHRFTQIGFWDYKTAKTSLEAGRDSRKDSRNRPNPA
jgi:hypothetical protein